MAEPGARHFSRFAPGMPFPSMPEDLSGVKSHIRGQTHPTAGPHRLPNEGGAAEALQARRDSRQPYKARRSKTSRAKLWRERPRRRSSASESFESCSYIVAAA
jgi:hypothetical protein